MDPTEDPSRAIRLVPAPPNDFPELIETYYDECRSRMPQIEAIAGKWTFEDLIPGLSDFDARFICDNTMTADDWCQMSMAVGHFHLELCQAYPKWARILEHPPGVNLTWDEFTSEDSYYPEYKEWTVYHCSEPGRLAQAQDRLLSREWDSKDEYFHLKRFLTYYGPYDRAIDPAINLGPYKSKYPLHSRLLHYFVTPVKSAICIIQHQTVAGKMAALRLASQMFPETAIFDEVIAIVQRHYEVPELYEEPALSNLEGRLFEGLKLISSRLGQEISILSNADCSGPEDWRTAFKQVPVSPLLAIFDYAKFARLTKGRLYFYTHAPYHFDAIGLIQNELRRIGTWFFTMPFSIFWEVVHGQRPENPARIVPELVPGILTEEEAQCTLAFDNLANGDWAGREIDVAKQLVDVFDGFFLALYKITRQVRVLEHG